MKYYSLNQACEKVHFEQAVVQGLAPDRGLYFPEKIPKLSKEFIENLQQKTHKEIAYEVIEPFVGDSIEKAALKKIIADTLCFDFPLVPVSKKIQALELYHGPTMAFKDVGARFMARCLGYFSAHSPVKKKTTVLVATSGDTGGAVAHGFLGVRDVEVVILYPSKKVSDIQEKQLTTLGKNIKALEVSGTFDDCQAMVKKAFLDKDFENLQLTSANSINIARWLPQMFYYFFAFRQIENYQNKPIVFSVPSGNFGNICAGMVAQKMGLPIAHFVAGTNINKIVPEYLRTKIYEPTPSQQTISNAMDVGNPSNFVRIKALHNHNFETLKKNLSGYSYTDAATQKAMQELHTEFGYTAEPHSAIGYLALKNYLIKKPKNTGVFLATAHPIKFLDVLEKKIAASIKMPPQIQSIIDKEKVSVKINTYDDLKTFLLD